MGRRWQVNEKGQLKEMTNGSQTKNELEYVIVKKNVSVKHT